MKLSEDLGKTANQNKTRKRELKSDENRSAESADDVDTDPPSKKNRKTHPDVGNHLSTDTPDRENVSCDKKTNDCTSIMEHNSAESSNVTDVRCETKVEKISPEKKKKKNNTDEISSVVDTVTSNNSTDFCTNLSSNSNEEKTINKSIVDSTNDVPHSDSNSPKKSKKKKKTANQTSQEIDIVTNNNAVDGSTNSSSNNEEHILVADSINNVSHSECNSPKKNKKKKKNTDEMSQEIDAVSSENFIDVSTNSLSNKEEISIPAGGSTNDVSQSESSSPRKKNKRKKTNKIDNDTFNEPESVLVSDSTQTSNSELRSENSNAIDNTGEVVDSSEGISPRKGRKRKRRIDEERTNESESGPSSNSADTPDADPNLLSVPNNSGQASEAIEKPSPKKTKRKKSKLDKNSNLSEPVPPNNSSENVPTSETSTKPLKSCLKKKKRKNRKKKNQKQINENSLEDDKKLANRSVSFDSNVQVEVIENCLVKSEALNARKKDKALAYLKRWKEKKNWKFEKLTQLWLLKNMFREDMIPSEEFDCLLEYMVDLKGAARSLVDNSCQEVISNVGENEPEEDTELQTAYTRARAVLQRLQ